MYNDKGSFKNYQTQQQDQPTKDNSNKLTNNTVIGVIKYRL